MARYRYVCSACVHGFELQHSAHQHNANALVFCPKCWQVAHRDAADYASITVVKQQAGNNANHTEATAEPHKHHAHCGCAISDKTWEHKLKALVEEEA